MKLSSSEYFPRSLLVSLHVLAAVLVLASCATPPQPGMEGNIIGQSDYERILELNSKNIETYQGLYNTVNMSAALLRTQLSDAQLKQKARLYQWDSPRYQEESSKRIETMKKQTEVFVSFYTPEKKHDDLHKNQTLWKIFLDADGKRYEGKAQKIKLLTSEVQGLYPFHNRFATPYTITFPVPATSLEGKETKLTITGSVGSVAILF